MRLLAAIALSLIGLLATGPAPAEPWPQRPISLLVQTPPGTLLDVVARELARDLTESLGQAVVVDNRAGGGGAVLLKTIAAAEPNGYMLGFTAIGPAVIRPLLDPAAGYDFDRDFTPIIMFGDLPNVLVVSPKLGLKSVHDFIAYAKAHPNTTVGHGGPGTIGHLAGVLFGKNAGLTFNFIAYRGSNQLLTDLMSGEINAGFPPYGPAAKDYVIATATEKRLDYLPDVPTLVESGYPVVASLWLGLVGPANLPPAIVARINRAINDWLDTPGRRARYGEMGLTGIGGAPGVIPRQVEIDRKTWTAILRENNITIGAQN